MPIFPRISFEDNIPVSDEAIARVAPLCGICRAIFEARDQYIESKNIDREIALPGGHGWAEITETQPGASELFRANRFYIERLRWFGHAFSGYSIAPYAVPESCPYPDDFVLRFIRLASVMPDRWILRLPPHMGEVGWSVGGFPVNHDTAIYQERLNLLYLSGIAEWLREKNTERGGGHPTILEIGA